MAILLKQQPAGILDSREWWSISDSLEVMVVYGKSTCSIHVTNSSREDVTEKLVEKLKANQSVSFETTTTIDSYFIECSRDQVTQILEDLESVC